MEIMELPGGLRLACCRLEGETGHAAGRRLLKALWQSISAEPMPEVLAEPRGKPYFSGNPVYFSISHTKRHAFCVVSPVPVGLDGEEQDRRVPPALADKILSPSEREAYDAAPDRTAALLRLWVLKEAAVKRSGEGLRGYPNHTAFSPDHPGILEIDGCYVAVLTQEESTDAV